MTQIARHEQIACRDQGARIRFQERIYVELQIVLKKSAKTLEDSSLELREVLLIEYFSQRWDAHGDADHLLGE